MAHASAEMPYFINPSVNLSRQEKIIAYDQVVYQLSALLQPETDVILKMSSINCLLKSHLPYYYWVGFYLVANDLLMVGPYQGTLGCLHINMGQGVCGRVAASRSTIIVDDVHALTQGEEHIACDPNSQSEIVLPVIDHNDRLIAVFDVDSSIKSSFDDIDQTYLERILKEHFAGAPLTSILSNTQYEAHI